MEGRSSLLSLEDMIVLHNAKERTYKQYFKEWKRLNSVSVIAQVIAVLCCIGTAMWAFCSANNEGVSWLLKIFAVVIGAAGGVGIMGVLFLILKPVFWLIRKKAQEKLVSVDVLQEEVHLIKIMIIQHCDDEYLRSYGNNSHNLSESKQTAQQLSFAWQEKQKLLLEKSILLRSVKLERNRYAEWMWVLSAVVAVVAIIALIIAYVLFILFIVIVGLIIFFSDPDSSKSYSNNSDYDRENETLLERIIDAITGNVREKYDACGKIMEKTEEEIREAKKTSREILLQLAALCYPKLDI